MIEYVKMGLETALLLGVAGLNSKIVWDWLKERRNGNGKPAAASPFMVQPTATIAEDARVARANTEAIRTECAVLRDGSGRLESALTKLTAQSIKNGETQRQQLEETQEQTVILQKISNNGKH